LFFVLFVVVVLVFTGLGYIGDIDAIGELPSEGYPF
jgi:hypothetical protein